MIDDLLRAVLDMAGEAAELAQTTRANPDTLKTRIKGPMDLVTAADHAVEDLLRRRISSIEPTAAILGEEGGLQGAGRETWILDPIDGTVNFSRGSPDWAISIARFDGTAITHGVIRAPDLGITAWARRGQGCVVNGRALEFDDTPSPSPLVVLGFSTRAEMRGYLQRIERLREAGVEHRRYGAATICFLGVLLGWVDAFHEPELNIWDAAAGLLMVEEAGGTVRHGSFADFFAGPSSVVAHNRAHPELAALLG